jgi:hypothetical protein
MSEDFLSRWSRRKGDARRAGLQRRPAESPDDSAGARAGADAAPVADPKDAAAPEAELADEEIAKLPSLDELTADSDISVFLRKGVPERLRNAALRRMWSLDPKIRDFVSEAREYAYDWNTPGGVPGFGGPLPPAEVLQKMAARILGAIDPGTEPKPAEETSPETPSQSGESSGGEPASDAHVGAPATAHALIPQQPDASRNPLETLRSGASQETGSVAGPLRDGGAPGQERREPPPSPSRPSRHGGAMPV